MSGGWLKRVLSQALQADHEEEQTGEVSGLHQLPLCRHCISLGNLVVFAGAVVRLRDAGRHRHGQHQERGGDDGASAVAVRGLQAFGGCGRVMHRRPGTMRKKNLPCISVSMHSWLHVTSSSLSWLFPEPLLLAGTSEASTSSAPSGSGMLPPMQCSAPCIASMISQSR